MNKVTLLFEQTPGLSLSPTHTSSVHLHRVDLTVDIRNLRDLFTFCFVVLKRANVFALGGDAVCVMCLPLC